MQAKFHLSPLQKYAENHAEMYYSTETLKKGFPSMLVGYMRISPAAWQHLHFLGHYAFRDKRNTIDLESILAELILDF